MITPVASANNRDLWAALRQTWSAVEEVGPVGALPAEEHLPDPEPGTMADALCAGIARIAHERDGARTERDALSAHVERIRGVIAQANPARWTSLGPADEDSRTWERLAADALVSTSAASLEAHNRGMVRGLMAACPTCKGRGVVMRLNPDRVTEDEHVCPKCGWLREHADAVRASAAPRARAPGLRRRRALGGDLHDPARPDGRAEGDRPMTPIPLAVYLADPRPDAVLWGPPGAESLHAQDLDEAIDDILADYGYDDPPETIEVAGYARMTVPASDWSADRIIDLVLTPVDEEYSDPNDDRDSTTPAMWAAAEAFGRVLAAEYVPWSCEEVVRVVVDVAAWLTANPASGL